MAVLGALGAGAAADAAATAGTTAAAAGSAAAAGTAAAAGGGLLSTIASVSPYLTLASAGISALGSVASGQQQAAALRANQYGDQVNAGMALESSAAQEQRQQIAARQTVAGAANTYGASGVDPTNGSPLDVLAEQAGQGALNSEITRWQGQTQANSYLYGASQAGYQADQAADAGALTAGTTLLTSGARYATSLLPRQGVRAGGML